MKQILIACATCAVAVAITYLGVCLFLIRREFAPFRQGFEALQWVRITYENRIDGTGPLHALAVWPRHKQKLPLVVVMHGFADAADEYFSEARYWAERDRFCLLVDMRGRTSRLRYPLDLIAVRDPMGWHIPAWYKMVQWFGRPLAEDQFESAGRPDANGAELLDIEAAVAAARRRYGVLLAPGADIIGYSGGGSNALLAAARMPYLFDRAVAFFPIIDFAQQGAHNATRKGAPSEKLREWIGGGPAQLPHHYAMRSAYAALGNVRHTRVWLFADRSDRVCPIEFVEEFARTARQHESISVRISGPGDESRWLHDTPDEHSLLHRAESTVFAPLPGVPGPDPTAVESWVVAGYLLLPDVEIFLGDLQQGVVRCTITRGEHAIEVDFEPVSAPSGLRATVRTRWGAAWVEHHDVETSGRVILPRE